MRDILVTAVFLALVGLTLGRPFVGVLTWFGFSIMNPHRLAFGFANSFPFAQLTAVITFLAWAFSKEPKRLYFTPINAAIIVFGLWTVITYFVAINPQPEVVSQFAKIWTTTIFASIMVYNRERVRAMAAIIAGSIGFYGVKDGIGALLTGGHFRVYGPPGSEIGENNDFGLACVMALPLIWYFIGNSAKRWRRYLAIVAFGLTVLSTLATQSRGAFVSIVAFGALLWWKSRHKVVTLIAVAAVVGAALAFMPPEFFQRINTIESYDQDASVQQRINAWHHAITVALARPITGGGMGTFKYPVYAIYSPGVPPFEAHSIFFQALGDQGFVGLGLFLLILILAYRSVAWVRRRARCSPELKWAFDLATCLQLSLIAYASGGAFLSHAYLDLYYAIAMVCGMLRHVLKGSPVTEKERRVALGLPSSVRPTLRGSPGAT